MMPIMKKMNLINVHLIHGYVAVILPGTDC